LLKDFLVHDTYSGVILIRIIRRARRIAKKPYRFGDLLGLLVSIEFMVPNLQDLEPVVHNILGYKTLKKSSQLRYRIEGLLDVGQHCERRERNVFRSRSLVGSIPGN